MKKRRSPRPVPIDLFDQHSWWAPQFWHGHALRAVGFRLARLKPDHDWVGAWVRPNLLSPDSFDVPRSALPEWERAIKEYQKGLGRVHLHALGKSCLLQCAWIRANTEECLYIVPVVVEGLWAFMDQARDHNAALNCSAALDESTTTAKPGARARRI
jgi:hypothetical protein